MSGFNQIWGNTGRKGHCIANWQKNRIVNTNNARQLGSDGIFPHLYKVDIKAQLALVVAVPHVFMTALSDSLPISRITPVFD